MEASSYTTSEHHLFLTYSVPFGIGSSIIFVLESLLAGAYFPAKHKFHVAATVAISLGFPLGFLILNPLTEGLIVYFDYNWKIVQRIYGLITLLQLLIFAPLFTEKYADGVKETQAEVKIVHNWTNVYFIQAKYVPYLTKALWLTGVFCISCGNNAVQINLVKVNF